MRQQKRKGNTEREIDIDFVLYFTLFKDFSSILTPTYSQEMFVLSLIKEENNPAHEIKRLFNHKKNKFHKVKTTFC